MHVEQILDKINRLDTPTDNAQFTLFTIQLKGETVFYGKDNEGNPVFAILSPSEYALPSIQKTAKLRFWFNASATVCVEGLEKDETLHVLLCKSLIEEEVLAFLRLTLAFMGEITEQQPKKISELFTSLTSLFVSSESISLTELQGFYAELYFIKYMAKYNLNLGSYWQKKDKLKFDFSLSEAKRIEVKSTLKEERIHHFRHEQLLSDLYDIKVVSFLLRRSDVGLSLKELVDEIRVMCSSDYHALMYVERFVRRISQDELEDTCFDMSYSDKHIKVYDSCNVPRFLEDQPKGVSKTEYDSNLTGAEDLEMTKFVEWVSEEVLNVQNI